MIDKYLQSQVITRLRFPLTVGVVFIHFSLVGGLCINNTCHGLDNPSCYFFIINLISEVFARICVPLFFVISGFLFFNRKEFNYSIYKQKLKTRFKTLFIPFIAWNILAIVWKLKCFLPIVSSYIRPLEIKFSVVRLFNTLFFNSDNNGIIVGSSSEPVMGIYPIDIPLWYIRELMTMVLLSPIIYFIIKRLGYSFTLFACLLWLFSPFFIPDTSYLDLLITALFFFSCGALFSMKGTDIIKKITRYNLVPFVYLLIAVIDALTKQAEYNEYIHRVGILFGIISIANISKRIIAHHECKTLVTLSSSSFFIFAMHYLIIGDLGRTVFIVLNITENNPYVMLLFYFAIPIVTVLLCIITYQMLKRFSPKLCHLLSGGRTNQKT